MSKFPREIQCPRCLRQVRVPSNVEKFLVCKACQFAIPIAYISGYKRTPPVFVQLFGLTAAGKTTFLDMLRLYLYDMDRVWRSAGFFAQPITQLDLDHRAVLLTERDQGIMPGSTPKRDRNQNEVYIMSLTHMERWSSRFLVLMDHSGESFGPLLINAEDIPFLQHTPVTILLLSLPDLPREGKRVNDLVTSYITTLESYKVNFAKERRQLIIVFSKADLIPDLPRELNDYLSNDNIYTALRDPQQNFQMGAVEMDNYIRGMHYISDITQRWVYDRVLSGPAMLHMLNDKRITTRFTVMSATGHQIFAGGNTLVPAPRRVLDPFFWVMEFYRQNRL